ncbi:MAG: DMSO/selenate family reductase complex B subunit [Bacillota bacterium]
MAGLGFYINMANCIGCKACEIACKDKNEQPIGVRYRKVETFEGGSFPKPYVFHLSMSCNHCEKPLCVYNCPTGALYKRPDGIVAHDRDKCIGCQYCTWSCPYGAPQYIEEIGKSGKCDFCADLIDLGMNPACVDACVMRALDYGDLDELRKKYEGTDSLNILPSADSTKPSVIINPKPMARKGA